MRILPPGNRNLGGQWLRFPFPENTEGQALRCISARDGAPLPCWTQTITMSDPQRITDDPEVHYGFPRLVRALNGDLVLFYRIGTTHADDPATIGSRISSDGGRSWSAERVLWEPDAGVGAHNPVAMVAGDGRIVLWVSRCGYGGPQRIKRPGVWSHSDDHGRSWAPFERFDARPGRSSYYVTDTLETRDGWIAALTTFPSCGVGDAYTNVWRSRDGGRAWAESGQLTRPGENMGDEVALLRTHDGRILCLLRGRNELALFRLWSDDEGRTWTERERVDGSIGCAIQRPVLTRLSEKVLLLTGRDHPGKRVVAYVSRDDGRTFGERHVLEAYQRDGAYTDTALLDDGRILIVWYSDEGTAYFMPDIKQSYLRAFERPQWLWIKVPDDCREGEPLHLYTGNPDAQTLEDRSEAFCRPPSFHACRLGDEETRP